MNKIYRRLWSTARQCWVVASELTAPRGKAASTTAALSAVLLVALLPDVGLNVAHATVYESCLDPKQIIVNCVPYRGHDDRGNSTVGRASGWFLMLGSGSYIQGNHSAMYGSNARSVGDYNAVFGNETRAFQGYSTVLGAKAKSDGEGTVSVGHDSLSDGKNSIAIGSGSRTAVGGGYSRIAIGGDAQAGSAGYTGGMAIGGYARSTHDGVALGFGSQATADGAGAFGRGAQATATNSLALGKNSVADKPNTVSVGKLGSERRIVNVRDGDVNSASFDAVNGRQLQGVKDTVSGVSRVANSAQSIATTALNNTKLVQVVGGQIHVGREQGGNVLTVSNKDGGKRYLNGVQNATLSASSSDAVTGQQLFATNQLVDIAGRAIATNAAIPEENRAVATGAVSLAIGNLSRATGDATTAVGHLSKAEGLNGVAMGAAARAAAKYSVALGSNAVASHERSVALGEDSATTGDKQVSVGNATLKRKIVNVDDGLIGAGSSEAVTGNQLFKESQRVSGLVKQANAGGIMYIGAENTGNVLTVSNKDGGKRYVNGVQNATLSASSSDAVTGQQLFATNNNVAAAQRAADDALGKANSLGGLIRGGPTGGMQLGAENTGSELSVRNKTGGRRVVTGLHNADLSGASSEAVTGQQLFATNTNVATAQAAADSALGRASILDGLVSQVAPDGNVRLGGENTGAVLDVRNNEGSGRVVSGVAAGRVATDSDEAISGKQLYATEARINAVVKTAVDAQTVANRAEGKVDVVGGLVSQKSPSGEMRLGGENTGSVVDVRNKSNANRTLSGLADGAVNASSTEAVTGRQLFGINEKVQANEAVLADHGTDLAAHSGRIADNRRDLDALRSEFEDFDPDLEGVVKFAADGSVDVAGGKLRGVAAGDISSATSTDAVNGGQLFATNSRISGLESDGRLIALGREVGAEAAQAGDVGVAIGNGAQASLSGEGGTAVGGFSSAMASNSVALGRGALVRESAVLGFALGAGTEVSSELGAAIGAYAVVGSGGQGSVALGAYSEANEADVVSVGNSTTKRRIINVERGRSGSDGATVAQVGEVATLLGGGASVDANGVIIAPSYNIQGGTQNNVGDALAALDSAVVTADSRVDSLEGKLRSVFQDGPSVRADGLNQLVLAGANGSVLTNLADGRIAADSRDAVNGSQLFAAKQEIARNRSDLDDMKRRESISGSGAIQSESLVLGDVDFGGARLTGVSDGRVSSTSSDVVTGAQLFGTNERVSSLETSGRVIAVSSKNEWNSHAKIGKDSVAVGEYAAASVGSEGGTAVGHYARADSKNSVAIGESSSVSSRNEGGVAVGSRARADGPRSVAIGDGAWVFAGADNSVAVGAGSESMRSNEFSIGSYSNRRRLTHVASGIASYDAATAGQLRDSLEVLGGGSTLDAQGGVVAPTYRVQGGVQRSVGDALASLDSAVVTNTTRTDRVESQLRAVFQDSPTVRNDGLNQLTFAGANGMVLSNVANGVIAAGSRDAVNGGQLHSMQQQLNGRMDGLEQRIDGQPQAPQSRSLTVAAVDSAASSAPVATPAADEPTAPPPSSGDKVVADAGSAPKSSPQPQADAPKPEAPTPQVDTAELEKMLARANEYSDGISREVDARLNKMDKRFNRMAAMSSAQSAMAMNTAGLNTYNRLGAGVGYSDGESAMAVGYQRVLNEKGSATFSLNGAFTNSGERSMGVGVGIGW